MKFPESIEIEKISKTNPEYEGKDLRLYDALYVGGKRLRNHMDVMLPMRDLEKVSGADGQSAYASRMARAQYINRAGGLIDWLTAAVFRNDPKFTAKGGDKEYWEGLNENADGLGTPFSTICREALTAAMIGWRSYFKARFDDKDSKNAMISVVSGLDIDDWQHDKNGDFIWGRSYSREKYRDDEAIASPNVLRHRWTYYAPDQIAIYEADEDADKYTNAFARKFEQSGLDPKAKAKLVSLQKHNFGCSPLFDIRFSRGQWVMGRIFEVLQALFRREAAITYALDMQAFALPVLTLNGTQVPSISGSEVMAVKLQNGESLTFAAPPALIFEPLFKDADRLKENLREVIQAMPVNAAAIPQAGRLSGDAVNAMRDPEKTLFDSFAKPVQEAAKRMLEKIAEFRNEEVEFEFDGFVQGDDGLTPNLDDMPIGKQEEKKDGENGTEGTGAEGRKASREATEGRGSKPSNLA